MATTNLPYDVFRFATVRAPRKPKEELATSRTVAYNSSSALYTSLQAQRAGANPRTTMRTTAQTFKTSNALYVPSIATLNGLFPGFGKVDDYMRTEQKSAVVADLRALVEGPSVLNQTAAAYVSGGGVRLSEVEGLGQSLRSLNTRRTNSLAHRGGAYVEAVGYRGEACHR